MPAPTLHGDLCGLLWPFSPYNCHTMGEKENKQKKQTEKSKVTNIAEINFELSVHLQYEL